MAAPAPVGIIGLGLVGSALAARLLDAGVAVIGFDIDPDRCRKLRDLGGTPVGSVREVTAQCWTVVVAVFDASQIETLLRGLGRGADVAGSALLCVTTCLPAEIEAIARHAIKHGLSFVE